MAVSEGKTHPYRPGPTSSRRVASILEQREGEDKKTQTWEGDLLARGRGELRRMGGHRAFAGSDGEAWTSHATAVTDTVLILKF